jgi:hypothetical protein
MATLQVSGERSGLVDDTNLLITAVVVVEVGMAVDYLLVVVLLLQRWCRHGFQV